MGEEIIITTNINSINSYTIQNIILTSSSIIYIDWGDDNIEEVSTNANCSHTYETDGQYVISIMGATGLGNNFLKNCQNVTEVIIPNTIISIGNNFLYNCLNVKNVTFQSATPPTLGTTPFYNIYPNTMFYASGHLDTDTDSFIYNTSTTTERQSSFEEVTVTNTDTNDGRLYNANLTGTDSNAHDWTAPLVIDGEISSGSSTIRLQLLESSTSYVTKTFEELGLSEGGRFTLTYDGNVVKYFVNNVLKYSVNKTFSSALQVRFYLPASTSFTYKKFRISSTNLRINVYEHCINNYITTTNYPSNIKDYDTIPTIEGRLKKYYGPLLREKLAEKRISSNVDDGLTTLVNKIKDIQTRTPRTGLLADIGFYDPSHWSGNAFGITEDTLVFYDGTTEFNFTTTTLPNNFTIGFVVTLHSSYDAITFNQIQPPLNMNYIVGPFDADIVYPDDEFRYTFEFEVIITRQNGGALKVCVPMSGDVWTSNNTLNLSIQPNSYITLSEIFYSYNYSDVESNNFESPYERVAYFSNWTQPHNSINLASVPSTFPILLMKDNKIIKRYDIFSDVTEYPFLLNWEEPYSTYNRFWQSPPYNAWEYLVQGAWHLKLRSDTSNYSWITTDDLYYPIGNYIRLKGKGENRIDTYLNRYIHGDGDSWESFDQYTTVLNQNMPQDWLISFDYTYEDSTQNKDFYIQIGTDNNNCIKLGVSGNNIFLESNTGGGWTISNDFDTPLNITLYTESTLYYGTNGDPDELHITYWLCINEYERGFETSRQLVENQTTEDILVHNLYKIVQNNNVDITNLMYMHFNIRDYEPPL